MYVPGYLRLFLKVICTISLLWLIFSKLNLKEAANQILGVEHLSFVGALLILFSLSLLSSLRWGNILKIMGFPLRYAMTWLIMLVANFFNQGLPSTMGGDIARVAYSFRVGMPVETAISNVVIDRLASFASLLLLIVVTLPHLLVLLGNTIPWWMTLCLILSGVGSLYLMTLFKYIPEHSRKPRFVGEIITFARHLSAVLSNRRWGWGALIAGFAVHVMRVIAIWILARGLDIEVSLFDCISLIPLALIVAMIPISIGGWGLREGAFLGAFSLVDVMPADSLALSITFGLSTILASLPGCLIWLFSRDIRESINKDWRQEKETSI